jgi:hypothetical protein
MRLLSCAASALLAIASAAAAVVPANGTISGPFVDRARLDSNNVEARTQFGYVYRGTVASPAELVLTGPTLARQKNPVKFKLVAGRQVPATLNVRHDADGQVVAVIEYTYQDPETGLVSEIRKGTGTGPVLAGWATPVLVSVVADPADSRFLIATFGVETLNGRSLPYLTQILTNSISGGTLIGAKPADFRAPLASAVQVRFRSNRVARWNLGGTIAEASVADVAAPTAIN